MNCDTSKQDLINSLAIRLLSNDGCNMEVNELINELSIGLFDWSCSKISTTEIATTDGSTTTYLVQNYELGKKSCNHKDDSILRVKEAVRDLCDFTSKELNMITPDEIRAMLYMRQQNGDWSAATADKKRLYLSSIYNYLYRHHYIDYNPMDEVEPIKAPVVVKPPFSEYELEKLRCSCESIKNPRKKNRDYAILMFALDTGMRVSEIANCNISDVDFMHNKVLVRMGKGNRDRYTYFTDHTKVRLEKYFADRIDIGTEGLGMTYPIDCPLFVSLRGGTRLKKEGIEALFRNMGIRENIEKVHPHKCRRTRAIHGIMAGSSATSVARMLGHSNLNSVNRYIHETDEQIATEARKCLVV